MDFIFALFTIGSACIVGAAVLVLLDNHYDLGIL
jgi:hypothetical protein